MMRTKRQQNRRLLDSEVAESVALLDPTPSKARAGNTHQDQQTIT